MAKADNEQVKRVRSAKAWLERAEESFDKQADVRGELNLMLAEAEMKNLRKNCKHGHKLRMAASILTILLVGLCVWQVQGIRQTAPALPVRTEKAASTVAEEQKTIPPVPETITEKVQAEEPSTPSTASARIDKTETLSENIPDETGKEAAGEQAAAPVSHTQPAPARVMTDREVQAAVQDARRSLRNAETKK